MRTPEAARKAAREWYSKAENRRRQEERRRRRKYGLTPEGFAWMLAQQGGACALCDNDPEVIDHDHGDGHVRALLCTRCNIAVGVIEQDRHRIRRSHEYADRV